MLDRYSTYMHDSLHEWYGPQQGLKAAFMQPAFGSVRQVATPCVDNIPVQSGLKPFLRV